MYLFGHFPLRTPTQFPEEIPEEIPKCYPGKVLQIGEENIFWVSKDAKLASESSIPSRASGVKHSAIKIRALGVGHWTFRVRYSKGKCSWYFCILNITKLISNQSWLMIF